MIKNRNVTLQNKIVQKSGNILSDMDGEKVMLSIQNGKYYNMGVVGGEIWERIGEPISVSELITRLMEDYDVERNECREQVLSFLEMLYTENLIEIYA